MTDNDKSTNTTNINKHIIPPAEAAKSARDETMRILASEVDFLFKKLGGKDNAELKAYYMAKREKLHLVYPPNKDADKDPILIKYVILRMYEDDQAKAAKDEYRLIHTGNIVNAITKMRPNGENVTIDQDGNAIITDSNNYMMRLIGDMLRKLSPTTFQLFDAICIKATETGCKNRTVVLPLSEYQEGRDLNHRQRTKEQAADDMEVLRVMAISGKEKSRGRMKNYGFINVASAGYIQTNGDIVFSFTPEFFRILKYTPLMAYPMKLQRIKNRINPGSYFMGRKIVELKRINIGKQNENIVSVKTLLESNPYLPKYAEVSKDKNRHVTDRIMQPFERDLDEMKELFSWEYCHSHGEPLTDEENTKFDYPTFENALIQLHWKNYPNQEKLIEARKTQQKRATRNKQRTTNKKLKQELQKTKNEVAELKETVGKMQTEKQEKQTE